MNICVFGASSDAPDRAYFDAARRLGLLLAAGGHTLVYGGGSGGLMGACAAGVKDGGGSAVGVAPRYFDEGELLWKDFGEFRFTDTLSERKALMFELAEAFIVLPGGVGTMDEFFEVLTLKQLGQTDKPIVLLNTLGCYDRLSSMLRGMVERGFVSAGVPALLALCGTPEEALAAALDREAPCVRTLADYNK